MNRLAHSLWIIAVAAAGLASPAYSRDLCNGNSYRCSNLTGCSINGKIRPCAYASGGAIDSAVIFPHGVFHLHWTGKQTLVVTYGDNGQFRSRARLIPGKRESTIELEDGVKITFPNEISHLK